MYRRLFEQLQNCDWVELSSVHRHEIRDVSRVSTSDHENLVTIMKLLLLLGYTVKRQLKRTTEETFICDVMFNGR